MSFWTSGGFPGAAVDPFMMAKWQQEAQWRQAEMDNIRGAVRRPTPQVSRGAGTSAFTSNYMFPNEMEELNNSINPQPRSSAGVAGREAALFSRAKEVEAGFRQQMAAAGPNRVVMPQAAQKPASRLTRAYRAFTNTPGHKTGMRWIQETLGVGKYGSELGAVGKWLGRGFIGLSAIQGYREGGVHGAVKSVATDLSVTYAMGHVWGAAKHVMGGVGSSLAVGGAIAGGVAMGIHASNGGHAADLLRPWMKDYAKKQQQIEMGTPIVDNFGTAATMRQRSVSAIQNSRLNGRTALGNEAALAYQPY